MVELVKISEEQEHWFGSRKTNGASMVVPRPQNEPLHWRHTIVEARGHNMKFYGRFLAVMISYLKGKKGGGGFPFKYSPIFYIHVRPQLPSMEKWREDEDGDINLLISVKPLFKGRPSMQYPLSTKTNFFINPYFEKKIENFHNYQTLSTKFKISYS